MLAALIGLVFAAGMAGVAWIFVFGDNTWPESTGTVLVLIGCGAAIAALVGGLAASYFYGKLLETLGGVRPWHAMLAMVAAIAAFGLGALIIK